MSQERCQTIGEESSERRSEALRPEGKTAALQIDEHALAADDPSVDVQRRRYQRGASEASELRSMAKMRDRSHPFHASWLIPGSSGMVSSIPAA